MSGASELRAFAADIASIAAEAMPEVDKVLEAGAMAVKDNLKGNFESSASFASIGRSISYDRLGSSTEIGFEIGPDKSRGGALANIAIFGASRRGGGATVQLEDALEREEAPVVSKLEALMARWAAK